MNPFVIAGGSRADSNRFVDVCGCDWLNPQFEVLRYRKRRMGAAACLAPEDKWMMMRQVNIMNAQ